MTELSFSTDINARPDRVLAVLLDVEHWPEWTATVTSVRRMDGGPFGMGSRVQIRQPKLLPAVWEVSELDGHSFTWRTRSPGLQVTGGHAVEATTAGSRATLSLKFSGFLSPLFARLYRDLSERYLRIEAAGLKKRSEA